MRRSIRVIASIVITLLQAGFTAGSGGDNPSAPWEYRWALLPAMTIRVHTGFRSRPAIGDSSLQIPLVVRNREDVAAAVHSIMLVTEGNELFRVPDMEGWPVILPGDDLERQVTWEFDRPAAEVLGRSGSVIVELRVGVVAEKASFIYGRHGRK